MKIILLSLTIVTSLALTSCGKIRGVDGALYVENGKRWSNTKLPLTLRVPKKYYDKYKKEFQDAEADFQTAAGGKDLIDFVTYDGNYELDKFTDSRSHWNSLYSQGLIDHGEYIVYIKDDKEHFTDFKTGIDGSTLGYAWAWGTDIYWGALSLNLYTLKLGARVYDVLLHEVGHFLGFQHITEQISWMNPTHTLWPVGFAGDDEEWVYDKYFQFIRDTYGKDLEKLAAIDERKVIEEKAESIEENFGLSADRSWDVSRAIFHLSKVRNKRSLTEKDYNIFSNKLLGFNYKKGKDALEKHIQGDGAELEELLVQAAEVNGTTPEHMTEIMGELFL
ncbi:MAG: hypothetical protein E2O68_08910 [Deltaproteobacteria bacterium]|nr:MAG: hypothetical protein E2O68_08910 [Deltaproteobacteria bacterium]